MAMLISNSFPAAALPALATGNNEFNFGGPDFVWAQLAVMVSAVIVFYEIGKRIDFAGNYRILALLAFAGALWGTCQASTSTLPISSDTCGAEVSAMSGASAFPSRVPSSTSSRPPSQRSSISSTGRVGAICILQ